MPLFKTGDASYLSNFFELFIRHECQLVVVINKKKIALQEPKTKVKKQTKKNSYIYTVLVVLQAI